MTIVSKMIVTSNANQVNHRGFTLLEVLIAIAIFALISLASLTIFDTVLTGDESSKRKNNRLNELNRAFIIMERDFLQIARRTVRINGEAPSEGYLHRDDQGLFSETNGLGFVRGGWTNPGLLLPRGDLQSVAYQLTDNTLYRMHFNFVDPVVGQERASRALLTDVDDVKFEFYLAGKWQKEFKGNELPLAIAAIIQTNDFGEIRRQFLVAGDEANTQDEEDNG